jgi:hypothetical protein
LVFVVLPELKSDDAMLDSTWLTHKTREEQQQMWGELLFYHSTKHTKNYFLQSLLNYLSIPPNQTQNQRNQQFRDKAALSKSL